jgi:hypothetical protein
VFAVVYAEADGVWIKLFDDLDRAKEFYESLKKNVSVLWAVMLHNVICGFDRGCSHGSSSPDRNLL